MEWFFFIVIFLNFVSSKENISLNLKTRDYGSQCNKLDYMKTLDPKNPSNIGLVSMPGSGNHWVSKPKLILYQMTSSYISTG